jgi:hypothetical protein
MGNLIFPKYIMQRMNGKFLINEEEFTITLKFKNIIETFIFEVETKVYVNIDGNRYDIEPIKAGTTVLKNEWFEFTTKKLNPLPLAFEFHRVQIFFGDGIFNVYDTLRTEYA